jgi:hypothetical protein
MKILRSERRHAPDASTFNDARQAMQNARITAGRDRQSGGSIRRPAVNVALPKT